MTVDAHRQVSAEYGTKHRQCTLLLYMQYSYKNLFSLDIWTVGFPEISVNFLTLTQLAAFHHEHHTSLKLSHP